MTVLKKMAYSIFYIMAFSVSVYGLLFLTLDWLGSQYLKDKFSLTPIAMYSHIIGGSVTLIVGALQMNQLFRKRFITAHKVLGRIYMIAVIFSGSAGLFMATQSMGGMVAHFGFGTMAVLWLFTVYMAYIRIRQGQVSAHKYWMILNYSLTCSAITLRLYLPSFPWLFNLDFMTSYTIISWMAWVPNILIAQLYLMKTNAKKQINFYADNHAIKETIQ